MKEGYPRSSFVFYGSFYEALQDISNEEKMTIIQAVIEYALYGNDPELKGLQKIVFNLIKPQVDANQRKFINGQRGAEHGVKGGRLPQANPTETPLEPQANPTETPNVNENVNVNVNEGEIPRKKRVFSPPSFLEIEECFTLKINEEGLRLNPTKQAKKFQAHYESNGWMVGKNKMTNYKSAIAGWVNRAEEDNMPGKQSINSYELVTEKAI